MRRPSPAMTVALLALVVALSGTAVAASGLQSGDSLIKKHSLSGNRLRNHTITGKQVNLGKLGKVPSAHFADTANSLGPLTWVPLTLINGWVDYHLNSTRTPAYAIDAQGVVHLRGAIHCSSGTTCSLTFAVFPAALQPSATVNVPADTNAANTGRLHITTSGSLQAEDPGSNTDSQTFFSLDGITFPRG